MSAQAIVSSLFLGVTWKDETHGFMPCPGRHLHKRGTSKDKDCKIHLNGAPTIFCFHESCAAIVEEANYKMRKAIWDAKPVEKREPTIQEKEMIRKEMQAKQEEEKLKNWATNKKDEIFKKYAWPIADVFEDSPFKSEHPSEDRNMALQLYSPDDCLWMGEPADSGIGKEKHFRSVKEWMKEKYEFHFTCPSVFEQRSFSRSNDNVIRRPYFVVESDTLTLDQTCSLFKWIRSFMKLRMIVFTGGKSMHGWFDFPSAALFEKLKILLPHLECDSALFKASQPVRIPGVMRGDKWQCIYYFNPTKL